MKSTKFSALLGALLLVCGSAFAGGNGFNYFEEPRTVCVFPPTCSTSGFTNVSVDLRMLTGVAKLDIVASTNAASTTTVYVQMSSDNTNFVALTNYALAVPTVINYTNGLTSTVATNQYMLSGAVVTPTASTSGFATSYIPAPAYTTTTASFTITNQPISIGFNIDSCQRYLRIGFAATATSTVGAYLTAKPGPWTP